MSASGVEDASKHSSCREVVVCEPISSHSGQLVNLFSHVGVLEEDLTDQDSNLKMLMNESFRKESKFCGSFTILHQHADCTIEGSSWC